GNQVPLDQDRALSASTVSKLSTTEGFSPTSRLPSLRSMTSVFGAAMTGEMPRRTMVKRTLVRLRTPSCITFNFMKDLQNKVLLSSCSSSGVAVGFWPAHCPLRAGPARVYSGVLGAQTSLLP